MFVSIKATPETLFTDASSIVSGICFEAAADSANQQQVFVLRRVEDLGGFYDLADNSQLCRRPVERVSFNFDEGRVLAGLWSAGTGCTARHDVINTSVDNQARTFQVRLAFTVEGDCPYELVRPFWIAVEGAADYQISIVVE